MSAGAQFGGSLAAAHSIFNVLELPDGPAEPFYIGRLAFSQPLEKTIGRRSIATIHGVTDREDRVVKRLTVERGFIRVVASDLEKQVWREPKPLNRRGG